MALFRTGEDPEGWYQEPRSGDPLPSLIHRVRSSAVNLSTVIRGERFAFADLREVFAKSNEEKSGDQLAGLAARTEREHVAAKLVLADLRLGEIVDNPLIDPDVDEVSRLICESLDRDTFAPVRGLTVGTL